MKKILIAEPLNFSIEVLEFLSKYFFVTKRAISKNELSWAFNNFDYFWFRLAFKIDKSLLHSKKRRVQKIICPVTGLNHIDTLECKKLGIHVISLKGHSVFLKEIRATAELTLGLTLAVLCEKSHSHLKVLKILNGTVMSLEEMTFIIKLWE